MKYLHIVVNRETILCPLIGFKYFDLITARDCVILCLADYGNNCLPDTKTIRSTIVCYIDAYMAAVEGVNYFNRCDIIN